MTTGTTSTSPTSATSASGADAPVGGTTHARLQAWVDEVAALTTPDEVV